MNIVSGEQTTRAVGFPIRTDVVLFVERPGPVRPIPLSYLFPVLQLVETEGRDLVLSNHIYGEVEERRRDDVVVNPRREALWREVDQLIRELRAYN